LIIFGGLAFGKSPKDCHLFKIFNLRLFRTINTFSGTVFKGVGAVKVFFAEAGLHIVPHPLLLA